MSEQFSKQLQVGGWIVVALLVLIGVWFAQSVALMGDERAAGDTITVSGTGKVTVAPDVAVADFSIVEEAATANIAQDAASRKSQAVVDYLRDAGIEETDIRTSGYSINPLYDYTDGRTRIRGYQVAQSLTVKVRDLDDANDILDGAVNAGVNQIGNVRFEIDDPKVVEAEARAKAIADAKAEAELLARQLGVSLGDLVSFSENTGGWPVPMYLKSETAAGGAADARAVPPELPAGENEVTSSVTLVYQIK